MNIGEKNHIFACDLGMVGCNVIVLVGHRASAWAELGRDAAGEQQLNNRL